MIIENWSEVKEALLAGLGDARKKTVGNVLDAQQRLLTKQSKAKIRSSIPGGWTRVSIPVVVSKKVSIDEFRKIIIPMIRRIIPGTIAADLIGVQPMNGPVGTVFTMKWKLKPSKAMLATKPKGWWK